MGFGAAMEGQQAIASIELEDEESGKLKLPHGLAQEFRAAAA
jgi:hypothetical protein